MGHVRDQERSRRQCTRTCGPDGTHGTHGTHGIYRGWRVDGVDGSDESGGNLRYGHVGGHSRIHWSEHPRRFAHQRHRWCDRRFFTRGFVRIGRSPSCRGKRSGRCGSPQRDLRAHRRQRGTDVVVGKWLARRRGDGFGGIIIFRRGGCKSLVQDDGRRQHRLDADHDPVAGVEDLLWRTRGCAACSVWSALQSSAMTSPLTDRWSSLAASRSADRRSAGMRSVSITVFGDLRGIALTYSAGV